MQTLISIPSNDGFYMPAEWQEQKQIWLMWPERTDNWRSGAKPAQEAFAQVAKAIAQFEPVTVCASSRQYQNVCAKLNLPNIRIIEMSSNDAWMRDIGPTFVRHQNGQVRGIDWHFNAWGGLNGGLYFPWHLDDEVASKILQIENCARYRPNNFVLEGGSIHVDGQGTLITTEECLLNANRNPHLSKNEIEQKLRDYLGVSTIIWLPLGLFNDETDGHIDNFCCFVAPNEVLLAWTDDQDDPNFERCRQALAVLSKAQDAKGRMLKIHKMPLPAKPIYATFEECASVDFALTSQKRDPSMRLAASYVNFLFVNDGILAPSFADPNDVIAEQILQELFPNRKVIMLPSREILLGGGNIHCITQQQPI